MGSAPSTPRASTAANRSNLETPRAVATPRVLNDLEVTDLHEGEVKSINDVEERQDEEKVEDIPTDEQQVEAEKEKERKLLEERLVTAIEEGCNPNAFDEVSTLSLSFYLSSVCVYLSIFCISVLSSPFLSYVYMTRDIFILT